MKDLRLAEVKCKNEDCLYSSMRRMEEPLEKNRCLKCGGKLEILLVERR
jgi:hypothetical protein